MDDPYDLERFVAAQAPIYSSALEELRHGRKSGHWMWFIFPQIAGLGSSPTSRFYALGSLAEARAYLDHRLLGARLDACVRAVMAHENLSARDILGTPDDAKLRSSLTLFAAAAPDPSLFEAALSRFFGGAADPLTLSRTGAGPASGF
ncbi:MAG TPA: DUF1810 domain-containing protein [Caulobacteraceae bacterium]|jgi:uncharacterized protein (DUF1810 family)